MSTSAAKDPAILIGHILLTECANGDCDIQIDKWAGGHGQNVGKYRHYGEVINIPKAHRNAIAEFLKV